MAGSDVHKTGYTQRRALVVLGMHRSGTSALTRVLNLCGAALPNTLMEPGTDNPAGFWESDRLCRLTEEVLQSGGSSWDDVAGFPRSWFESDVMPHYRERLAEMLREEFGDSPLLVIKDPRLCRLVPLLEGALREIGAGADYIVPLRNPLEVAESLKVRNDFSLARGMLLWLRYMLEAERSTRRASRVFVNYDDLLTDWRGVVCHISETLGISLPRRLAATDVEIDGFITADLKHRNTPANTLHDRSDVSEQVKTVYQTAVKATQGEKLETRKLDQAWRWLDDAELLFRDVTVEQERLSSELTEVREQAEARGRELERREQELTEVREQVEARDREIAALTNSISWRVTAPARFVSKGLRTLASAPGHLARSVFLAGKTQRGAPRPSLYYRLLRMVYRAAPLPGRWKIRLRNRYGQRFVNPLPVSLSGPRGGCLIGPCGLETKTVEPVEDALAVDPSMIEFPDQPAPELSIVIPVYGEWRMTVACLEALAELTDERAFEVIVVDDASPDESGDVLSRISGLRYARNETNGGFIYSCNRGVELARGEYVFVLNNDTLPQEGCLEALLKTFEQHDHVGLVGAKLFFGDGALQEAGGIVWADASAWNYGRDDDPRKPEYNYVRDVDYCSGAAIGVPTALWRQLCGFDTYYTRAYYEDTDLAFRVRKAGYRVLYQPMCRIIHLEGRTSGTDESQGEKAHQAENRKKFFHRWKSVLRNHRSNGVEPYLERDRTTRGRVLIIGAVTPTPDQDSGSLDVVNLIRMLHKLGYKTTFIPQTNFAYFGGYTDDLQMMGVECLYYPYAHTVRSHLKHYGGNYDYVLIHRIGVFQDIIDDVEKFCPDATTIFHTSDLHFLREKRQAELEQSSELRAKAAETQDIEMGMIRRADATIVVSSYEKEIIGQEHPELPVFHMPLIRQIPGRTKAFSERADICFIGGFQHPPNEDAVLDFVKRIWPAVQEKLPEARFLVAGSQMPDTITELGSVPGVEPIGYVEDLEGLLGEVRLTVAPLRYGAGAKGKLISSMVHGTPVVGSRIAVEGMDLQNGTDVAVADDVDEWVDAVTRLYKTERAWTAMSDCGLHKMEQRHSMRAGLAVLEEIFQVRESQELPSQSEVG